MKRTPIVLLNEFSEVVFIVILEMKRERTLVQIMDSISSAFIFLGAREYLSTQNPKVERDSKRILNNLNFSLESNNTGEITGFTAESSLPYFDEIIYISPVKSWKKGCASWKEYYQFTITKKDLETGARYVVGKEDNNQLLAKIDINDIFIDYSKHRTYIREDTKFKKQ